MGNYRERDSKAVSILSAYLLLFLSEETYETCSEEEMVSSHRIASEMITNMVIKMVFL